MTTISRSDGVQFALLSYREFLTRKNVLQLKQEIRSIAQTNGQFARLFKKMASVLKRYFPGIRAIYWVKRFGNTLVNRII